MTMLWCALMVFSCSENQLGMHLGTGPIVSSLLGTASVASTGLTGDSASPLEAVTLRNCSANSRPSPYHAGHERVWTVPHLIAGHQRARATERMLLYEGGAWARLATPVAGGWRPPWRLLLLHFPSTFPPVAADTPARRLRTPWGVRVLLPERHSLLPLG